MTEQFTGPNISFEGLTHSIPTPKVFPEPAVQLTYDLQEVMGDLCFHESLNHHPLDVFL
jgi:hypothetical protein